MACGSAIAWAGTPGVMQFGERAEGNEERKDDMGYRYQAEPPRRPKPNVRPSPQFPWVSPWDTSAASAYVNKWMKEKTTMVTPSQPFPPPSPPPVYDEGMFLADMDTIDKYFRCECGAPMKAGKVNCEACFKKWLAEHNRHFDNVARIRNEQEVADALRLEDWNLAKDCMIVWGACALACAVLWALKAMTPFAFAVVLALEAMAQ